MSGTQPGRNYVCKHSAESLTSVYTANGQNGGFQNSNVPRYGTVIPNRVFVGGIDFKVGKYSYSVIHLNFCLISCVFNFGFLFTD